jgi:hypothetical protein
MKDYISARERLDLNYKKESSFNVLNGLIVMFICYLTVTGIR